MAEGEGQLLVLLIDASENLWNQLRTVNDQQEAQDGQTLGTAQLAQQLLLFLNSYLMLQDGSQLAVYAIDSCGRHDWVRYRMSSLCYADMLAGCSHLLFLSAKLPGSQGNSAGQSSEAAAELVLGKLTQHMARRHESSGHSQAAPCWSAALSRALCLVRKLQGSAASSKADSPKPRILCIDGSPDVPSQYIAVMNAIFSAQRHGVVIETCMLGPVDSPFLQQAAHVTEGVYLRPARPGALLQYLLAIFSSDTHTRGFLQMPTLTGVDFRASCFCHKKTIDIGFVCSVCLSIFCQKLPECSTCGTDFSTTAASSGLSLV